jgi:hypothetical protein
MKLTFDQIDHPRRSFDLFGSLHKLILEIFGPFVVLVVEHQVEVIDPFVAATGFRDRPATLAFPDVPADSSKLDHFLAAFGQQKIDQQHGRMRMWRLFISRWYESSPATVPAVANPSVPGVFDDRMMPRFADR